MKLGPVVLVTLGLLSVQPLSALAQTTDDSPFSGKKVITFAPEKEDKIQLARQFIAAQRTLEAADILESIYEKDPENQVVQNLLRTCYDRLEWYDKAELLVRRMMEGKPYSIGNSLYLAELLAKMGRTDEALTTYQEVVVAMGDNAVPQTFAIVVNSMMRSQLYRPARERIDSLRTRFGDLLLFGIEKGEILERESDYAGAALEYLPHLAEDTTRDANRAERKLLALLQFEESAEVVEPLLVQKAEEDGSVRTMRLLAEHYLKTDKFDQAFAYTVRQDSLEQFSGVPLVQFMHRCYERQRWDKVAQMAELILSGTNHPAYQQDISFEYASALARLGRYQDALSVYSRLAVTSPGSRIQPDAYYGIGALYMNYLGDLDSALHYFQIVTDFKPHGNSYLNAMRAIPLCHMKRGELELARDGFETLGRSSLPDEFGEEVAYRISQIDFFRNDYDSARTGFNRVLVNYPRGYYVNNALRMLLAIQDASEDTPLLNRFAEASLLEFRGEYDSALSTYQAIAAVPAGPLGDISLIRVIETEIGRADSTAALIAAERLADEFPESYYRPIGLKWKADILSAKKRDEGEAREIYRTLLENYPDYPFVREVRTRLQQLQESSPVG